MMDALVVVMLVEERESTLDKLMDEMGERQAELTSSSKTARTTTPWNKFNEKTAADEEFYSPVNSHSSEHVVTNKIKNSMLDLNPPKMVSPKTSPTCSSKCPSLCQNTSNHAKAIKRAQQTSCQHWLVGLSSPDPPSEVPILVS
jgi:hypothetical protein